MKRKTIVFTAATLLVFVLILEFTLREKYGFCQAVLFKSSPVMEYIPVPQDVTRFGNRSYYNSFSQRNREWSVTDTVVVLGFGDSVLNGGVLVPQDSLASTLLTSYLTWQLGRPVLVTNISAGSWGPDNCFAYLEKYGNFNAKVLLLVVSSHDAFDNMDFKPIVGKHPSYPDKQATFALWELWDRYLRPRIGRLFTAKKPNADYENLQINKYKPGAAFNSGFQNFKYYADSTDIPLIVYLHAEKGETLAGQYHTDGQMIIKFCKDNGITIIQEIEHPLVEDDYLDKIHLSSKGQRKIFYRLKDVFVSYLKDRL